MALCGQEEKSLYHGSPRGDIVKFRKSRRGILGAGIYFSDKVSNVLCYAEKRGRDSAYIYEVKVLLTRPCVIEGSNGTEALLEKIYGRDSVYRNRERKQGNDVFIISSRDILRLRRKGYDGIIWQHPHGNEYVLWDDWRIAIKKIERVHDA
jgi:hypothetical protein